MRNALNFAVREWEWLERNPFERVKIEKPHNQVERWLIPEEEQKLLDSSPAWLKELIIFAINTGTRRDEMLSLKWSEVDFSRRVLTLLVTKNKEKRTVPMNEVVSELLKAKSKGSTSEYAFGSETGTKMDGRNLLRAFYVARKKAGLEDVRWHDLRHTFATRLVQAGIDLYTVKELLGHKTLTMTMRYAHHYPESLRRGVDVLVKNGDILVTVEGKRNSAVLRSYPEELEKVKENMVGDGGFEPSTSAV